MRKYKLYIDESGGEHRTHQSQYYVLVGCIIESSAQQELANQANQIKYRYWKRTNVPIHSAPLDQCIDDFEIFKGHPDKKAEFTTDIINLINATPIRISCCLVDKTKVYGGKAPWKRETIIIKTATSVVMDFLRFIYGQTYDSSGVVIYEASSFNKDSEYLKVFTKMLTPGWEKKNQEFFKIREHLTSVTFATKLNRDIETEIADLMGYAATRKYLSDTGQKPIPKDSYEDKIVRALQAKLLAPATRIKQSGKNEYTQKLAGFRTLPD